MGRKYVAGARCKNKIKILIQISAELRPELCRYLCGGTKVIAENTSPKLVQKFFHLIVLHCNEDNEGEDEGDHDSQEHAQSYPAQGGIIGRWLAGRRPAGLGGLITCCLLQLHITRLG